MPGTPNPVPQSHVVVVGRLGSRVDKRTLPSGDDVTVFTVIVDRPDAEREAARPNVDAIPCQTFKAPIARKVGSLPAGEVVRVEGVLRRRFWRAGGGLGSALDVDVRRLERVRTATRSRS